MDDLLRILAILGLVGANAFFVVGEYAVVTARRSALAPRAQAGSAGARAALRLMDDPVRVISTVQVGITALGILTGAIGEPLVRQLLGDALPTWANVLIAFAIVTYLSGSLTIDDVNEEVLPSGGPGWATVLSPAGGHRCKRAILPATARPRNNHEQARTAHDERPRLGAVSPLCAGLRGTCASTRT